MDEWKDRLVHLDHCRGMTWKGMYRILKDDPELLKVYSRPADYWKKLLSLESPTLQFFLKDLHDPKLQQMISIYEQDAIRCISFLDKEYPITLTNIYQQPWNLYAKGNVKLLTHQRILAIIGTRAPTHYGQEVLKRMVPEFVAAEMSIVSGLAKGIDAMAHRITLQSDGDCIAVIGGGLYHIYPQENTPLSHMILRKGLILSEYPPIFKPKPWHFPMRNRIISGLSRAILVVESKQKSGTFITVERGLEQGKDIFAIPGNIFSASSSGTNAWIKEGAKLVTDAYDIISEWE
ncbi:DNA-protecting protein DprA [Pradoshia eiseniae]|uniref:DNA-protecting protein DprA n=1 Tax=Pradoshia eiseniae TaxID=2064768 RepID=A0A2S7N1K6_9BACI|nr:DNA-processing protein DprA [Pradoshia eiseniae]PQD95878.1 DNA-protecting protein DprA [Pradoshia eiseniae]